MSRDGELLDSHGNPIKVPDSSGLPKRLRRRFRSFWSVLSILIAGGLITAVFNYRTSEASIELEREKFEFSQAQKESQLSIEYWLGPPVLTLSECLSNNTERVEEEHGPEFRTACETEYIPADYQSFDLVAASGYSFGQSFPADVQCATEGCRIKKGDLASLAFSSASVYAVVWNETEIRSVDIEIQWANTDRAAPVESQSYENFVDVAEADYKVERIGDLAPRKGILLPVASVTFDALGGDSPRYVIPTGRARFPVSVRFSASGVWTGHALRTPAETTRIVDNGTPWTELGG